MASVIEELTRPRAAVVVEARQIAQLPAHVVEEDQTLVIGLGELRWRWTLDPTNPDKVSFAEYARAVGRDRTSIQESARGHEQTLRGSPPQAPVDHRGGARTARPSLPSRARPRNDVGDYLNGIVSDLHVLENCVWQWRRDPTYFTEAERITFHRATRTLRARLDSMEAELSYTNPRPPSAEEMYAIELPDEPA